MEPEPRVDCSFEVRFSPLHPETVSKDDLDEFRVPSTSGYFKGSEEKSTTFLVENTLNMILALILSEFQRDCVKIDELTLKLNVN